MVKLSNEEKIKLYEDVSPIAAEFRRSFITDDDVIEDTFQKIQQLGFLLIRFPATGKNSGLSGFTIHKEPYDCIYINSNHSLGRQYLSCWHECFHIITKEGNGLSYVKAIKEDPIEYKANIFASMILMPENLVKKYVEEKSISIEYISHIDIIKMQNYFKVSYSAMLTRLMQIYPQYKKALSNRYAIAIKSEYQREKLIRKTKEASGDIKLISPSNDIYIPDSFYEDLAFNIQEKRISKNKAFEILKIIDGLNNGL